MKPARYDCTIVAGDTFPFTITYKDEEVRTGSSVLTIRERFLKNPVLVAKGLHTANGVITFKLQPEHTQQLDSVTEGATEYIYSIQYTSEDGTVQTILSGLFTVLKNLNYTL